MSYVLGAGGGILLVVAHDIAECVFCGFHLARYQCFSSSKGCLCRFVLERLLNSRGLGMRLWWEDKEEQARAWI